MVKVQTTVDNQRHVLCSHNQGVEMKVKTNELIDVALDWAVAKCEMLRSRYIVTVDGFHIARNELDTWKPHGLCKYLPSILWAQAGPIIEREDINVGRLTRSEVTESGDEIYRKDGWTAYTTVSAFWMTPVRQYGPTPLVAVMRCLVQSKLGAVIDVPEELCKQRSN